MSTRHLKNQGVVLLLVLLLQVFFFRYFNFKGYSYCFFYTSVLFLFPSKDQITNMFLGVFVGLFVDVFEDTLGMHTAVCVFLMYLKPKVLSLLGLWELEEEFAWINPFVMGVSSFFLYLLIMVVLFVLLFSIIEVFQSQLILRMILQTIFSSVLTLSFITAAHYLLFDKLSK